MAEHHRLAGQARWAGKTREERVEGTEVARRAKKTAREQIADLAEQIAVLRAQMDERNEERVAA